MILKRKLNLSHAVLLVVGNVVGAGIFTTSGFLAKELPDPVFFIGIWVLGGFLTICGALTYAELAGMFPKAGGDYQFLKAAYGGWAGFLLGWVVFWIINPGSMAALSLAVVQYLKPFLPIAGPLQEKAAAVAIMAILSWINYRDVGWAGATQNLFTIGSLVILVVFIGFGVFSGNGHLANFASPASGTVSLTALFGAPMIAVIFTFSGWFASTYVAGEVKNPGRNLPLSLLLGTGIVTVLYVLINVVYLYSASIPQLAGIINVAELSATSLFSPEIAVAISIAIIAAIISSLNATVLAGSRVYYAMSEDAVFWPALKRTHARYDTPHIAILVQGALACILLLLGTFEQLLGYVVFIMLASSIATGTALLILRRSRPDLNRPYRTWGYPYVPLIFIGAYAWIAFQVCRDKPVTSLIGLLITLSGLPFYFYWRRLGKTDEVPFEQSELQSASKKEET